MTCKVIKNDAGETIAIACGSSWGMGAYIWEGEYEGEGGTVYGFLPTDYDPHDVSPDFDCNTEKEIAAWQEAKLNCPCPMGEWERQQQGKS